MVAFEHGLAWVVPAALISGAGMGLLSPALTVVVQNSVPVARMGSATTSQQFVRQVGAALGVSAFVLAATVGGFRTWPARHDRRQRRNLCLHPGAARPQFACALRSWSGGIGEGSQGYTLNLSQFTD